MKTFFQRIYTSSVTRFALVGGIGSVLNVAVFYVIADLLHVNATIASTIAFAVAVTQNYFLNRRYSFRRRNQDKISFLSYGRYVLVNLVGLAVNLVCLNLVLHFFAPRPKVIAQIVGIGFGTIFNYVGSRFFVFKKTIGAAEQTSNTGPDETITNK